MRPPCEYVVKTYIPQVRARIIRDLIEKHGWGPSQVARTLKITLTSVLKYKRILSEDTVISPDFLERVAEEALSILLSKQLDPETFIEVFCRNCMLHRIDGEICKLHRAHVDGLENCQACSNVFKFLEDKREERNVVIYDILSAYSRLIEIPDFDILIPQVRTNIVECIEGADNIEDVAAFPGRLTTVKGKLVAASRPEFNASKHLAEILVEAHKKKKNIRGLICIKYSEEIDKSIEELGFKVVYFSRDEFKGDLKDFLSKIDDVPDIIVDKGGLGIEPVTYVFGEDAIEVAEKIVKIYNKLTKG